MSPATHWTAGRATAAGGGNLVGQLAEPVLAPGDQHHAAALPGEFPGDLPADAAGGPGDDGTAEVDGASHGRD